MGCYLVTVTDTDTKNPVANAAVALHKDNSISIRLPVLELCFVLAALLGARLIASNVALAADNDLFI